MKISTKFFSAIIFISVLLGVMDGFLSVIVILCNRPNSYRQQTLSE